MDSCKQTGMEAIERLRFLASFGPPSTGKRKGGEKTQPFNRFHSHHGRCGILTRVGKTLGEQEESYEWLPLRIVWGNEK